VKIEHSDINFREETLNGVLYLPENKDPSPLIIHLNGMPGIEPEKEGERFAQDFSDNGFAFYAFDYSGVRNSTGLYEYYYSQENINRVVFGLSEIDDGSLEIEDFISIPDLVAGALCETLDQLNLSNLRITPKIVLGKPDVRKKTDIICDWIGKTICP